MDNDPRIAFVAGATGYTGREVVRLAALRGIHVVAHVRPDSSQKAEWQRRFSSMGAEVDTTAWDVDRLSGRLSELRPDFVFALLGTTKARARRARRETGAVEDYESVDYGLTSMLLTAARTLEPQPKFIYLSAAGVSGSAPSAYFAARRKMESELRHSGMPYVIARPSFITGSDRDESRPAERAGAAVADAALGLFGALGAGGRRIADRYRSTTNTELAGALVSLALDPARADCTVEASELRSPPDVEGQGHH